MYLLCNYHPRSRFIPSLTLFFLLLLFFSIAHKLPNVVDKGLFICFVPHQNGNMTRSENWPLLQILYWLMTNKFFNLVLWFQTHYTFPLLNFWKRFMLAIVLMADGNSLLGDAATYNYLKNYLGSLCISLSGLGGVSTVAVREIKCKNWIQTIQIPLLNSNLIVIWITISKL